MADESDPRTVLQAHKLRTQLAGSAFVHGGNSNRGRNLGIRILVISAVLALLILGGIIVTGYVIDLISSGNFGRRR